MYVYTQPNWPGCMGLYTAVSNMDDAIRIAHKRAPATILEDDMKTVILEVTE